MQKRSRKARPLKRGASASARHRAARSKYDEYVLLARLAEQTGDRIAAENYLQHAEHFLRTAAKKDARSAGIH